MTDQPRLSRRSMVATVAGGAALGAIWGAAFPIVASEARPSLAIVGHRGGQLVLIDSGEARALVFLGQPDDALIERIPAMMTLFRQRIDVVIGSKAVLEQRTFPLRSRWAIQHAVIISGAAGASTLAMPSTVITEPARIDFGGGMTLECVVGYEGRWLAAPDEGPTLWTAQLSHPAGTVVMVPDGPSLDVLGPLGASLLILPDAGAATLDRHPQVGALALNHDSDFAEDYAGSAVPLTRIYPQDIARIAFGDDGIQLPPWTASGEPHGPVAVSGAAWQ